MEYVEAFFIQPITYRSSYLYIQTSNKAGKLQQRPFIETIKDGLFPTIGVNDDIEEKTEEDYQREVLEKKPWRDTKIKYLTYQYRPWKESYKERYQGAPADSDRIYIYGIPSSRLGKDRTRIQDVWGFPWLWTKTKADRLAWLHKLFYADVRLMTAQEHIEMDALFAEYDMPLRWGLLRLKEIDVLNVIALNLAFWTDFNGVKPTDLGLRPDGTVRTCPVQFHTCISSSNDPRDTEHYAPPFKWSRNKSPEQAYEEIKAVYQSYPKRGLKWSSGWIDRGGWKPQIFGDSYFYANGESLVWHYVDDIEFSLDVEKRLVQYRSSTRLGQTDWDVEKNRYNQFVRMLKSYGGWEVSPLQKDLYIYKTPYRWIDLLLTKSSIAIENVADRVINQITMLSSDDKNENTQETAGLAREQLRRISATIDEVLLPLRESTNLLIDTLSDEPGFRELIKIQKDIQSQINSNLPIYMNQVEEFTTKVEKLFPSGKIIGSDNAKVVPLSPNVISTESNDIDNEDNSYESTLTQPSPQTSTIRLSNPFGNDIKVPTLKPDINFNSLLDKGDSNTVEKKKREKTIISADEFRNMKGINTKDEDTNKPWLSSSRNSLGKTDNSRGKQNNVDFLNNEGNEVETIMGYLDEDTENTRAKGTLNKAINRREPLIPASQLRSGRLQLGGTPTVADTEQWGWLDGV